MRYNAIDLSNTIDNSTWGFCSYSVEARTAVLEFIVIRARCTR